MKAFCTYVRPLLEYSTHVWSPQTSNKLSRRIGIRLDNFSYILHVGQLHVAKLQAFLSFLSTCTVLKFNINVETQRYSEDNPVQHFRDGAFLRSAAAESYLTEMYWRGC